MEQWSAFSIKDHCPKHGRSKRHLVTGGHISAGLWIPCGVLPGEAYPPCYALGSLSMSAWWMSRRLAIARLDEPTNPTGAMKRDKAPECEMSFAYEVTIAGRHSHWPVRGHQTPAKARAAPTRAFSSEVDPGSRKENLRTLPAWRACRSQHVGSGSRSRSSAAGILSDSRSTQARTFRPRNCREGVRA
jgi:hypothetical protein